MVRSKRKSSELKIGKKKTCLGQLRGKRECVCVCVWGGGGG